jgi:geranylgeranyl diphosphate synthase type II
LNSSVASPGEAAAVSLTPAASYPADLLALVEEYLADLDFGADARAARLVEAMRYSLLAGGKRIRPVLTLATARGRGADPVSVLPTAAALELIHTYSLIHDDLPAIDDDTLRRGRPTCHVAFGEDVAILAGDGLFAEAFKLVLLRQAGSSAAVFGALAEIASATGVQGMVGGQYMDVAGEATADDDLRTLHALKTGRLIQAAVICGALLSGAEELEPYRAFAAELGLLFQIVDDILDETGAEDELGKSVGKDRELEKVTYVSRFGMQRAVQLSEESERRALRLLAALPGDTADLGAVTRFIHERRR